MRLDVALVERGLARSRNQAARLIAQGRVSVAGRVVRKPSTPITDESIVTEPELWVSRAAYKLIPALEGAGISVPDRVLDAGASTGGFTQVCLSRGAGLVYAVDVGHDQLALELRADHRVRVIEGLNLRELDLSHVDGDPVPLVVADVSFISLTLLLEPLFSVCSSDALLLVKPQFEVGKESLAGGVVTEEARRRNAVQRVIEAAERLGWECRWQAPSILPGTHGNIEFFLHLVQKAR
ncbi:TlyA family RNA methyltransferase [Tessaracoccus sp. OH4464_COT-324]|uniref:TlyA family RNA methyltransferase n=1 Tax=Tessaracoccus sp. OH4464_COT-324 TaxID=2491059 RepID=UPI000F6428F7|nr:TlyA family RNA methyltransferase [Tessaracoccus sp. OH4464_COT-324]RRD47683.1 TlyA family RNA methyltransferase [Tessaracoccus sp. OH4464_COT-324]